MKSPNQKTLAVGTWNISGATLGAEYYANRLRELSHGIVAVQEAHSHQDPERSSLPLLARELGMVVLASVNMHQSHINPDYTLTMGVLCAKDIAQGAIVKVHELPQPPIDLEFPDGTLAIKHNRPIITVTIDDLTIAALHNLPLERFGHSYEDRSESAIGDYIRDSARSHIEILQQYPYLILLGDFNFDNDSYVMTQLKHNLLLQGTTQCQPASVRDWPNTPDQIIYSLTLECLFLASRPVEHEERRLVYGEFYRTPISPKRVRPCDLIDINQIAL